MHFAYKHTFVPVPPSVVVESVFHVVAHCVRVCCLVCAITTTTTAAAAAAATRQSKYTNAN